MLYGFEGAFVTCSPLPAPTSAGVAFSVSLRPALARRARAPACLCVCYAQFAFPNVRYSSRARMFESKRQATGERRGCLKT